jgi:hypothetical protein
MPREVYGHVAARRLKSIGKALEMPWLSWYVFHRTRVNLSAQYGRHLLDEFGRALLLNRLAVPHPLCGEIRSRLQAKVGS